MCLPALSLLVSALFRWPCSISIHVSPRSVAAVSALFRWPCSMSIHLSPRSVTVGVRPFPLAMQHFYSLPKQFTVRGSQFFLKMCPPPLVRWTYSVSIHLPGSAPAAGVRPFHSPNSLLLGVLNALKNGRLGCLVGFPAGLSPTSFHLSPSSFHLSPKLLACLPLPFICLPLLFICLPVLFICLPGWVLVVGFPGGLAPTSFHLSPTSFHLSPSSFHLSPRLGACGRVPGWLVSHFLSFVSQFFSFVSQAGCLWVGFPAGLSPHFLSFVSRFFHLSPSSFHSPNSLLLGVLNALKNGRLEFPAGVSPTSFHLSPSSFHLSPRLGACGRVPAGVSPTSFHLFPISFHLSPTTFHLSSTSFHASPSSFHLSPRLGACGRVPGWLVSHCLSFVSHFFSFVSHYLSFVSYFFSLVSLFICLPAGCLWSGSRLACLPLPFIVSQAGCLWSGSRPFPLAM